jgi:hypothetical protein
MKSKPQPKQSWTGFQPPPPGASAGYMAASRAVSPLLQDVLFQWRSLKTPEAMAVFADCWVSMTAHHCLEVWPVLMEMLTFIETHQIYADPEKTADRTAHASFQAYLDAKIRPMLDALDASGITRLSGQNTSHGKEGRYEP